jgi:uncharacterized protein (DUF2141 family)
VVLVFSLGVHISALEAHALPDSEAVIPHDMSRCDNPEPGKAYVRVSVHGFRNEAGNIRAQIYDTNPDEFLEKGRKLVRVDVKTEGEGQQVCVPLPAADTYALVVMHDRNANGKADFFSEGFGFSNNPDLGLAPPDAEDVMFVADEGVNDLDVSLKYIIGGDEEQTKKRRQLRRR